MLPQGVANETWVTSEFLIPNGVTQISIGVLWSNPASGATFYINRVALYKLDYEYQYFLSDQLGSPRVVLQTNAGELSITATMETENHSDENTKFLNLRSDHFTVNVLANATPGGNEALWMNNTWRVGPARSMKVFPGDKIDASVWAYYNTMSGLNKASFTTMASALIEVMSESVPASIDGIVAAYNNSSNSVSGFLLSPSQGATRPSAFLNYILFDDSFVPLKAESVPVGATAGQRSLIPIPQINVEELGHVFIYLSYDNESSNYVYFDDFKIKHTESPVIQVNAYYPFGMTSYSWQRDGEEWNKYLYQGKEYDSLTQWHDFHARQYDGALGRFLGIDPAGQFMSPYSAMANNPISSIDPDGRIVWFVPIIVGAVIGGTVGGIHASKSGDYSIAGGIWRGALIGAAAGAGGAGVSAAGGGAMLAGAAGGAIAGAGFAGMQSNWNGEAMLRGGLIGAASGFVGGGFASAIGGGAGAFVGGVASDVTSQLLSTGHIDPLQAGIAGAASFGMYHGMSYYSWKWGGGNKFGNIDLKYKEFKTIQAEYQRARFWHREHGVTLLKEGSPKIVPKQYRYKDHVDFPSPNEMKVDVDNIKAQWHSHWNTQHVKGFSTADLIHPYNQMVSNRYSSYSFVNYNYFDENYTSRVSQEAYPIVDQFLRFFLFNNFFRR